MVLMLMMVLRQAVSSCGGYEKLDLCIFKRETENVVATFICNYQHFLKYGNDILWFIWSQKDGGRDMGALK